MQKKTNAKNKYQKISRISNVWKYTIFNYINVNKNKLSEFALKSLYYAIYRRAYLSSGKIRVNNIDKLLKIKQNTNLLINKRKCRRVRSKKKNRSAKLNKFRVLRYLNIFRKNKLNKSKIKLMKLNKFNQVNKLIKTSINLTKPNKFSKLNKSIRFNVLNYINKSNNLYVFNTLTSNKFYAFNKLNETDKIFFAYMAFGRDKHNCIRFFSIKKKNTSTQTKKKNISTQIKKKNINIQTKKKEISEHIRKKILNIIINIRNRKFTKLLGNEYEWSQYKLYRENIEKLMYCKKKHTLQLKSFVFSEWLLSTLNYWLYNYLNFKIIMFFFVKGNLSTDIIVNKLQINNYYGNIFIVCNKLKRLAISKSVLSKLSSRVKKRRHKLYTFKKRLPWINKYLMAVLLKNLHLKIVNTLQVYLKCNIIFSCGYLKKYVPPITNVKMLVNFIRLTMQRGKNKKKPSYLMKRIGYLHLANRTRRIKIRKKIRRCMKRYINNLSVHFFRYRFFLEKYSNTVKVKKDLDFLALKYNEFMIERQENYIPYSDTLQIDKYKKLLFHKKFKVKEKIFNFSLNFSKYLPTIELLNLRSNLKLNSIKIKKINTLSLNKNYMLKNYFFDFFNSHSAVNLSESFYSFRKKFYTISKHVYPIGGMRIEISGPPKKGRRTRTTFYRRWVPKASLLGKASLSNVSLDVTYWQSYFITPVASYGFKLWVVFITPSYTRNKIRYDDNNKITPNSN